MLIAIGSTTYMLLGRHLAELDPSSISRTLQGFLSGIGFLGGAVIFKSGFDVKGIKAAAAIWITGALGLAIATSYWWLGITVGLVTAVVMFVADSFPDEVGRRSRKRRTSTRTRRNRELDKDASSGPAAAVSSARWRGRDLATERTRHRTNFRRWYIA